MSVSLNLQGLRALAKAMDRLPDDLADKAGAAVRQAAVETAAELRGELPKGPTGNLKRGVRLKQRDPLVWQVISGAPHAFIHEEGTGPRVTKGGASRGISPAHKTVAKVASRNRRALDRSLERVLVQVLGAVR